MTKIHTECGNKIEIKGAYSEDGALFIYPVEFCNYCEKNSVDDEDFKSTNRK